MNTGVENNSIKILDRVSNDIEKLTSQLAELDAAKTAADAAIESALNCFDEEDDNKKDIEKVLKSGANDITEAKKIITEFINRLSESRDTWKTAENKISESIAQALQEAMQRDGISN